MSWNPQRHLEIPRHALITAMSTARRYNTLSARTAVMRTARCPSGFSDAGPDRFIESATHKAIAPPVCGNHCRRTDPVSSLRLRGLQRGEEGKRCRSEERPVGE